MTHKGRKIRATALVMAMVVCALVGCGKNKKEMAPGVIANGTYTNEYMGFTIDFDSTWTSYDAVQLEALTGTTTSNFTGGARFSGQTGEGVQIYDMMLESEEEQVNINVAYEVIPDSLEEAYAETTDEELVDELLGQGELLQSLYAQAGMEDVKFEKVQTYFLDKWRTMLKVSATVDGVTQYSLIVLDYWIGDYAIAVTFTSFGEDKTLDLLGMCEKIEK